MPGLVSAVIFGAVMLIAMALIYALSGESLVISERLGRLWRLPGQGHVDSKKSRQQFRQTIVTGVAKLFPSSSSDRAPEADPRLIMAGFRGPEGAAVLRVARVVVIVALVGLVFLTGLYKEKSHSLLSRGNCRGIHFAGLLVGSANQGSPTNPALGIAGCS